MSAASFFCCFLAKEQKFWDKSKKLRSYHRLLKKEGVEARDAPRSSTSGADDTNTTALGYVPSTSIARANPDAIFAAQEDSFTRTPTQRPKKKRTREPASSEGADESANGASASSAAAAEEPEFKKQRRLTPTEIAQLKAEKKRQWEEKQANVIVQQEKRKERHTFLTQKTSRGQPVLANQMEVLLEKLKKQAAANK